MKAASVTPALDGGRSRNAEEVQQCPCRGHRARHPDLESELAYRRTHFPHCLTCHSGKHYACLQCGRCLPASGFGAFTGDRVRRDRLTCSPACRQKAYRARRRTA